MKTPRGAILMPLLIMVVASFTFVVTTLFLTGLIQPSLPPYIADVLPSNFRSTKNVNGGSELLSVQEVYQNSTFGYSFRFPETWLSRECGNGTFVAVGPNGELPTCETEGWGIVQVKVFHESSTTLAEALANEKSGLQVTEESTISFGGQLATKLVGESRGCEGPCPEIGTPQRTVLFLRNGNLFYLQYYGDRGDYVAVFENALATFEFAQ